LNYSEYTVRDIVGQYNRYGLAVLKSQEFCGGSRRASMSILEKKELLKEFSEPADTGKIAIVMRLCLYCMELSKLIWKEKY
jgi:transposase